MDAPTDLDALAEALRGDGVVVDRVMGSGEAQDAHDRIARLVRETPFPVYVALVQQPDGLPEDSIEATDVLAGLLNRRLGDGLYVLETSGSIQQVYAFGLGTDPARLSLGAHSNDDRVDEAMQEVGGHPAGTDGYVTVPATAEAEAQVRAAEELVQMGGDDSSGDYPATVTEADARDIAERALHVQAAAQWRPDVGEFVEVRTASRGLSALVGGLGALVIALLLGQTLRGWPRKGAPAAAGRSAKAGRRSDPKGRKDEVQAAAAAPPDLEEERARAVRLADILVEALASTDWEAAQDRDLAGRALTARDALEPLLVSDDVADVIGAQVISQTGAHDLGRGRRGSGPPFVPCFFDPRHRPGTATASWRLGDGQVEVPCCASCAKAVARGATPMHLRLAARRGTQPYWERDDVWARTGFGAVSDDLARDVLADRAGER